MSNSDQMEERAARLRATRKTGPNTTALAGIALLSGLAAGGAGVYFYVNQEPDLAGPTRDTSTSLEFQRDSPNGLTPVITPEPAFTTDAGPTDAEVELQRRVQELETMLQSAQGTAGTTVEPTIDTAQIEALQTQLDQLVEAANAREQEMVEQVEALRTERDGLARDQSRTEAEMAGLSLRLEQAEDDTAEQLRLAAQEQAERQRQVTLDQEAEQIRQERLAELERRRAEAAALLDAQINSPIDGLSGSGSPNSDQRQYTGDEAFIRAGSDTISPTQSRVIGSPSNTVMQGTVIEATMSTGIVSELSGTISSTVSYDVWSFDMTQVLIPRGSQMFGRYSNEVVLGQRRVLVAWDRLVTPNGQVVDLEAYGSDNLGRSGLTGSVDNRVLERFGSAAAISVFGALPTALSVESDSGIVVETSGNLGEDAETATTELVQQYLNLAPIITVEHGSIIMVMVTNDLELF